MVHSKATSLRVSFAQLEDPRRELGRLHSVWDMIALTICAVICGAEEWVDIEKYGRQKQDWLETFLELPNGIPSHDTLGRVFGMLDPVQFQQCFADWVQSVVLASEGRLINIDGKSLRASRNAKGGKQAIHLVSAWAQECHPTLGQVATSDKSNEITAIPELLRLLDVQGAIVTIDAMGCQKAIAAKIVEGGGDYLLALKKNQETLYDTVHQLFSEGLESDFVGLDHQEWRTTEEGHGRREERD